MNQAWAGHSGSPFKQAESYVQLGDFNMQIKGVVLPHQSQVGLGSWGKEAESWKTTGKGAGFGSDIRPTKPGMVLKPHRKINGRN